MESEQCQLKLHWYIKDSRWQATLSSHSQAVHSHTLPHTVTHTQGKVYTLSASARSDQYNKDKEVLLRRIVESFRVR